MCHLGPYSVHPFNCRKANMELVNSASHSCLILIGQLTWKPTESCQKRCQKVVTNLSKVNFVQVEGYDAQYCNNISRLSAECSAAHTLLIFNCNIYSRFHSFIFKSGKQTIYLSKPCTPMTSVMGLN